MKRPANHYDARYKRLLRMGQFERRSGAWRFGANRMTDAVVDRLLESGCVERVGGRIQLKRRRQ